MAVPEEVWVVVVWDLSWGRGATGVFAAGFAGGVEVVGREEWGVVDGELQVFARSVCCLLLRRRRREGGIVEKQSSSDQTPHARRQRLLLLLPILPALQDPFVIQQLRKQNPRRRTLSRAHRRMRVTSRPPWCPRICFSLRVVLVFQVHVFAAVPGWQVFL